MFLSWWRRLVSWVHRDELQTRRGRRKFAVRRFPKPAWGYLTAEALEDRIAPATFKWTGLSGAGNAWTDPGNWTPTSGTGTVPNAPGDVAQFTGTITGQTSVVVNQNITVGEIDFATASNISILGSGNNVLTLQNTSGNS